MCVYVSLCVEGRERCEWNFVLLSEPMKTMKMWSTRQPKKFIYSKSHMKDASMHPDNVQAHTRRYSIKPAIDFARQTAAKIMRLCQFKWNKCCPLDGIISIRS